jgi:hypothetical protein
MTKVNTVTQESTRFLNVDHDMHSRARLEQLIEAFGKRVLVHHVGPEKGMFVVTTNAPVADPAGVSAKMRVRRK